MKTRIQATKALQPTTINDVQALNQFYLPGLGATTFIQMKKQEKTPSQTRESDGARGPLSRGALVTERAHETVAGYLHPRGALMGRVATSRPHGSERSRA